MAQRGAVVVAQRNLLEIIQGVNVVGETTVRNMMTESDYVYTRVEGVVKGAEMVGKPIVNNGMIEVTLRIPIYSTDGLAPVVKKSLKNQGPEYKVTNKEEATPIAFNLKDKNFDPSMFPVAYDENGEVIFDFSQLSDVEKGKFGKYLNYSEKLFNDLNFKKGVEIIDVAKTQEGKIILDEENKDKLIDWKKAGKTIVDIAKILMFFI